MFYVFIGGPSNKTVHLMTVRSNAVSWRNRTLKCPLTLILSFYEETKKQTERLEMKKRSLRLVYISIVRSRHHVIDLYFYSNVLFFLRCRVCTWDVNRLLHLHWRLPHPLPMSTINPSDRTWKVDLKLTRLFCSFNYFICHLIGQCSCLVKFVKNLISIQVTCKHFPSINLTFS